MEPNEMMGALLEAMSHNPEFKRAVLADIARKADLLVGTPKAREASRAQVKDDPDALRSFNCMCAKYDLNQIIVQTLGNIKSLLRDFDGNNFSTVNAEDNLSLFKTVSNVLSLATINVSTRHDEYMKEIGDPNETGDGNASG